MSIRLVWTAAALAVAVVASPAAAEPAPPPLVITAGAGSAYMFHALALSKGGYVSVGAESTGAWYAGANANFFRNDDPDQVGTGDLHAGYRTERGPWSVDAEVSYNAALNAPANQDYALLDLTVTHKAGPYWSGVDVLFTPDGPGSMRKAGGVELRGGRQLSANMEVHGSFGIQSAQGVDLSYRWWRTGVSYRPSPGLRLVLDWDDTSRHSLGKAAAGRVVVTVSKAFG